MTISKIKIAALLTTVLAVSSVSAVASLHAVGTLQTTSAAVATKNFPISAAQALKIDLQMMDAEEMRAMYSTIINK